MATRDRDIWDHFRRPTAAQVAQISELMQELWDECTMRVHTPGTRAEGSTTFFRNTDPVALYVSTDGEQLMADVHRILRRIAHAAPSEGALRGGILSYTFDVFRENGSKVRRWHGQDLEGLLQQAATQPMADRKDRLVVLPVMGACVQDGVWARFGLVLAEPKLDCVLRAGAQLGWSDARWNEKGEKDRAFFEEAWTAGMCVAVSRVDGTPDGARSAARTAVRAQLAVLNLVLWPMALALHPIRLLEDSVICKFDERHLAQDGDWSSAGRSIGLVEGKLEALVLDRGQLAQTLSNAFHKRLSRVVENATTGHACEFHDQLTDMLIWLGRSRLTADPTEVLLFAVVALETGLGLANNERIANTLARYTALLVESRAAKRFTIYRRVQHWYALRSEIVHAGSAVTSEAEAEEAFRVVFKVAGELIQLADKFTKAAEFRAHMERWSITGQCADLPME